MNENAIGYSIGARFSPGIFLAAHLQIQHAGIIIAESEKIEIYSGAFSKANVMILEAKFMDLIEQAYVPDEHKPQLLGEIKKMYVDIHNKQ